MRWASVVAFVRLGRPLFLVGGFVLYGLGAAIARTVGHPIDIRRYLLGQAAVTALQLMTHYANDYYDYDADRANATPTRWSGGSRVLADGALPRRVALIGAVVLAALGVVFTTVLATETAVVRVAVPLLAVILVLSWGYSGPPLRLCATGTGEIDAAVVVTGLVPVLAYALQAPALDHLHVVVLAVLPLMALQVAMMLAIELPDAAGDAATGKRTLVVRLGPRRATALQIALIAAAFLLLPYTWQLGLPGAAAAAAGAFAPLAAWQIHRLWRGFDDPATWEGIARRAVVLVVGTSAAELLGFILARS